MSLKWHRSHSLSRRFVSLFVVKLVVILAFFFIQYVNYVGDCEAATASKMVTLHVTVKNHFP